MAGVYIIVAIAILLVFASVLVTKGKGSWLIPGYSSATQKERDAYDKAKLHKAMGITILSIAIMLFIMALLAYRVEMGQMSEAEIFIFGAIFLTLIVVDVAINMGYTYLECRKQDESGKEEVSLEELNENAFKMIGKDWLLLTAKKGDKVNTMTASWGGVGSLGNKKVAYLFVRPQRYTKEFIDASDKMSISVLPNNFRDTLSYLGRVSGRDEDKIEKSGLTLKEKDNVPYFEEARLTFICRKLYVQSLEEEGFIDKSIIDKDYQNKDYHMMYVVEIEELLK